MIDLQHGSIFAGHTIERRLGVGGWGTVFLARDDEFRRPVAVKLLNPRCSDTESRQRAFLSPKQATDGPVDHRSDQYSLACTVFQLLTDEPVFAATEVLALLRAHADLAPPNISDLRPELRALDPVFARALAKLAADRFDSCADFADAARSALRGIRHAGTPNRPSPADREITSAAIRDTIVRGRPGANSPSAPVETDADLGPSDVPARRIPRPASPRLALAVVVIIGGTATAAASMVLRQNQSPVAVAPAPQSYASARAVTSFDRLLPATSDASGFGNARCSRFDEPTLLTPARPRTPWHR